MQYDEKELQRQMKAQVDAAIKSDRLKPSEAMRLLELYESQMLNKTYLNIEPKNGRKPRAKRA